MGQAVIQATVNTDVLIFTVVAPTMADIYFLRGRGCPTHWVLSLSLSVSLPCVP